MSNAVAAGRQEKLILDKKTFHEKEKEVKIKKSE
jgi:hypothetical protein